MSGFIGHIFSGSVALRRPNAFDKKSTAVKPAQLRYKPVRQLHHRFDHQHD